MWYLDWFGTRVSNPKHIPSTVWISPRFKRKFIPNWYVLWYHYPTTVMTCQKFGSVSGGKLIKHNLSSRSREAISFFIMPTSSFAMVSPLNFWQVFCLTHYHIPWLQPVHPSNTGFHPLVRVAQHVTYLLATFLPPFGSWKYFILKPDTKASHSWLLLCHFLCHGVQLWYHCLVLVLVQVSLF